VSLRVAGEGAGAETSRRRRSSISVACFSVSAVEEVIKEVVWWWISVGRGWVGSSRDINRLLLTYEQEHSTVASQCVRCGGHGGLLLYSVKEFVNSP